MLEANQIFGAQHFVIYNYSCGSNIGHYLRQYMQEGLADIIPWSLPLQPHTNTTIDLYYYGQLAAYTDCVYRNLYRSRYVIFLDLDEILVPRSVGSWFGLLEQSTVHKSPALPVWSN